MTELNEAAAAAAAEPDANEAEHAAAEAEAALALVGRAIMGRLAACPVRPDAADEPPSAEAAVDAAGSELHFWMSASREALFMVRAFSSSRSFWMSRLSSSISPCTPFVRRSSAPARRARRSTPSSS